LPTSPKKGRVPVRREKSKEKPYCRVAIESSREKVCSRIGGEWPFGLQKEDRADEKKGSATKETLPGKSLGIQKSGGEKGGVVVCAKSRRGGLPFS